MCPRAKQKTSGTAAGSPVVMGATPSSDAAGLTAESAEHVEKAVKKYLLGDKKMALNNHQIMTVPTQISQAKFLASVSEEGVAAERRSSLAVLARCLA